MMMLGYSSTFTTLTVQVTCIELHRVLIVAGTVFALEQIVTLFFIIMPPFPAVKKTTVSENV